MANLKEGGARTPRELEFWGEGKATDIDKGFAIVSLRNPGSEPDYDRGEYILAHCRDDKRKVPVVVFGNDIKPLEEYPVPVLALDGFFSAELAADGMKIYPGYENTAPQTPMQAFTFVKEEIYSRLTTGEKVELTGEPLENLIKKPRFRHVFLPTMCFWLNYYGGGLNEWLGFLEFHDLVTAEELKAMREDAQFDFMVRHREAFAHLVNTPSSLLFKPIILGVIS